LNGIEITLCADLPLSNYLALISDSLSRSQSKLQNHGHEASVSLSLLVYLPMYLTLESV